MPNSQRDSSISGDLSDLIRNPCALTLLGCLWGEQERKEGKKHQEKIHGDRKPILLYYRSSWWKEIEQCRADDWENTITAETEEAEIIKENLSLRLSYLAK